MAVSRSACACESPAIAAGNVEAVRCGARLSRIPHFRPTAPSIAASKSASSKTMNGALPPNSIETRSTSDAARAQQGTAYRCRPGERQLPESGIREEWCHRLCRLRSGDNIDDSPRYPHFFKDRRKGKCAERRLLRRFDHHRAPSCDRWSDLSRHHSHREVPRSDKQRRSDRFLGSRACDFHRPARAISPGDPDRLFGKPTKELRGVEDLTAGLAQRLSHLQRHEKRESIPATRS